MVGRSELGHRHGLPLEIANRPDPVRPEQFVTADVHPTEKHDREPCADRSLAGGRLPRALRFTYWTSLNPSVLSSSSATYCGATQTPAI